MALGVTVRANGTNVFGMLSAQPLVRQVMDLEQIRGASAVPTTPLCFRQRHLATFFPPGRAQVLTVLCPLLDPSLLAIRSALGVQMLFGCPENHYQGDERN